MTSPTGSGNINNGFISDNIGTSCEEEEQGALSGTVRRNLSEVVLSALQSSRTYGSNTTDTGAGQHFPVITTQPSSSARAHSLLGQGSLHPSGQNGGNTFPRSASEQTPICAQSPLAPVNSNLQPLLNLLAQASNSGFSAQPTSQVQAAPVPEPSMNPETQALLRLLSGGTTPSPVTQPMSQVQAAPVPEPSMNPEMQALLRLLSGGTTPSPVTQPMSQVQAAPVPEPSMNPEMQALLRLLSGGTTPSPVTQPTSQVQAAPIPEPGMNPETQALLRLLSGGTTPNPVPRPFPLGNMNPQALQSLLGSIVSGNGGQNLQWLLGQIQNASGNNPLLQAICSLFQGQGGGGLQQGLAGLAGLMAGRGASSSNLSSVITAISGLSGLAGPAGVAVSSIASLLAAAASSEAVQRSGRFCYDNCHSCCEGNCGCPGCGCAFGQCGCGSFGHWLCGIYGNCCGVQVAARKALEKDLKEIEEEYGDTVLLIALSNLGTNTVGLLAGDTSISVPPLDLIRRECTYCSRDLPRILQSQTSIMWANAAQRVSQVTRNGFLRRCFVSGLTSFCDINPSRLERLVRIVYPWGGDRGVVCAAPFNMEKIARTLPDLTIMPRGHRTPCALGTMTAASVMQILGMILMKATQGERQIWIGVEDLMTLVCMILASKGHSIYSETISLTQTRIYQGEEMQNLMAEVEGRRRFQERLRGPIPSAPIHNPYIELAVRCFSENAQRAERLRNPRDESRNQLLRDLSSRWMLAAGILSSPVVTQPLEASTVLGPRASRYSRAGRNMGGARNYDLEGARPRRGGNGRSDSEDEGDLDTMV
ncbi:hypothetical protein [Chlamydia felis Fe/C-56]|uniref:Uncharacterized protein n=2 Tax=Chlamydia felis TaxID=83556 RepID=Q253Z8_CHLFF|nr:hypothetical protein [Chlamydia felis]BAE81390.1 hypothetical protein [Chlamydia felis Fe/C-56]